jgi:hypothetical protein
MTAGRVNEGSSIPDAYGKDILSGYPTSLSNSIYTTIEVIPFKLGTKFRVTQESIDGSEFNVINDSIEEAGQALADAEDLEIFKEFFGRLSLSEKVAPSAANKVYQATSYPLLSVTKVVNSAGATTTLAITSVDYKDGKIKCSTSATGSKVILRYKYSTRTDSLFQDPSTATKLGFPDLIGAKTKIVSAKWRPNTLVIDPLASGGLESDDRFSDASKYGGREEILNGEIGKIAGLKVLVTTNVLPTTALLMDTTRGAYLVLKRNLDMKKWDAPDVDSTRLFFYEELAPKVINEDCFAFVTNIASNSDKAL